MKSRFKKISKCYKKILYVQNKIKADYKVKKCIKNIPSKLRNINLHKGVLKKPGQISKREISAETANGLHLRRLTGFQIHVKNSSQKFPMYKIKQKKAEKLKIKLKTI